SLVIEGNKEWHGVGHSATVSFDGVDYLFSHGYDAADTGRSKLRIDKINWVNGWPVVATGFR
ncbi:MAG: arabinan endo-1,5-alpha-L-arabinosidase, partial [Gemmatimonadaceae bacterium]|nr:arabinan endo-1,5-alpha-L-arabinosidase [Chitinophagaceae bacterium]